jgi:hypothetical protein
LPARSDSIRQRGDRPIGDLVTKCNQGVLDIRWVDVIRHHPRDDLRLALADGLLGE